MIKMQFSAWDGSHRGLERYVKQTMKNPDSYKHVETRYIDNGDHLVLITTFRGTNSFNAVITTRVQAKADLHGNIIEILGSDP